MTDPRLHPIAPQFSPRWIVKELESDDEWKQVCDRILDESEHGTHAPSQDTFVKSSKSGRRKRRFFESMHDLVKHAYESITRSSVNPIMVVRLEMLRALSFPKFEISN